MYEYIIIPGVLIGYILTSYLFLKFPSLLHKKKSINFKAVHISHRGGCAEGFENTISAFVNSAQLGTDMLEIDCHLTADGQVVVCHDSELSRLASVNVEIGELAYSQLPALRRHIGVQFMPGVVYSQPTNNGVSSSPKIALLRDVFAQLPQMPVNIDIKIHNELLIEEVLRLITEFNRERITVLGSKNQRTVARCRQLNPRILTFCSFRQVIFIVLFFYLGLLPFYPIREEFFEVPMPSIILAFLDGSVRWHRWLVKFFDLLLMRPSLFGHLKKRGITTYIWVLNTESQFERALHYVGCDGVMTDCPTLLREYLLSSKFRDRGLHWQPSAHGTQAVAQKFLDSEALLGENATP